MKLKIATVVGTRPEIIKMSQVIRLLDEVAEHRLVHTGQNYDYELNQVFFDDLGLRKPDYFLDVAADSPCKTIANVISKTDDFFSAENPDALVIYGDTNSCLCVLAAKRRKIPVFHLEAGNRCFDQRVPEELNRKIVDHLSDINLVHSDQAKAYLVGEGIPANTIMKVGSPMPEVFLKHEAQILKSDVLQRLSLLPKSYFVLSAHREENVDDLDRLKTLVTTIDEIARSFGKRVVFSVHPRTQKKMAPLIDTLDSSTWILMKPLGFFDYIKLQKESFCVLSDSGTLTEEVDSHGFPGIMIRQTHERPEGTDQATCLMSDVSYRSLRNCVELATSGRFHQEKIHDYQPTNFSEKVVRIVFSYIDFVNRTVWSKPGAQRQ